MKALLALNESTTAEILADLLNLAPEQAQAIAVSYTHLTLPTKA